MRTFKTAMVDRQLLLATLGAAALDHREDGEAVVVDLPDDDGGLAIDRDGNVAADQGGARYIPRLRQLYAEELVRRECETHGAVVECREETDDGGIILTCSVSAR